MATNSPVAIISKNDHCSGKHGINTVDNRKDAGEPRHVSHRRGSGRGEIPRNRHAAGRSIPDNKTGLTQSAGLHRQ
jgi:hypothetical protein